jgi:hypothetical protein
MKVIDFVYFKSDINGINENLRQGSIGSELKKTSGGQFATKADRLDQAKVDAVLGAGKFKAGSAESNLALAQYFRQAGAGSLPAKPVVPSQTPKTLTQEPAAISKTVDTTTPYSTAADVAGVAGLGAAGLSMAGKIAPKVAGLAAKTLPGLNVAYQGADALRRASIGDTTGSAISAAGAIPALGIPAVAAQALRDKYRTGSFFPSDEELKAAVDKDKQSDKTNENLDRLKTLAGIK